MRIDPGRLIGPLVAVVLFVLILQQTAGALRASGVWSQRRVAAPAASPFAGLEQLTASVEDAAPAEARRNPFAFERAPARVTAGRPAAAPPAPQVAEPARPVLTAIIWSEESPSATIRWNDRDYPVQVNSLFDEFRVVSIARDQVALERGGETLVLRLPEKGD